MKFADILQSVGLGGNGRTGIELNATAATIPGRVMAKGSGSEVDRLLHHGYKSYHTPNAYHQQMDLGLNPTIGNLYYPQANNMFGHRGFGLRLGGIGGSHTHGIFGHPAGFGHSGYGGHVGGTTGGGSGGYDHNFNGRQKSKGSSVMTALTLLSFFFFINLLQNCLKEHMDTMNPTVMVMTAGVARNRLNKLTEVNSREIPPASVNSDKDQLKHEDGDQGQQTDDVWYMNSTSIGGGGVKIEPKLKNDYFRDGSTFYMRIN